MDDTKIEERFTRLERSMNEGFARMDGGFARLNSLIDVLANLCTREFKSIAEHFTVLDTRLESIEGKMEAFARRVDDEVEARHVLGERVSRLEQTRQPTLPYRPSLNRSTPCCLNSPRSMTSVQEPTGPPAAVHRFPKTLFVSRSLRDLQRWGYNGPDRHGIWMGAVATGTAAFGAEGGRL